MDIQPPDINRWWKHRRRMAYICLFALIGFGSAAIIVDISEIQSAVVKTVIYACGFIIFSYIGASTADDIFRLGK